jgi:hypothetical protein
MYSGRLQSDEGTCHNHADGLIHCNRMIRKSWQAGIPHQLDSNQQASAVLCESYSVSLREPLQTHNRTVLVCASQYSIVHGYGQHSVAY